MNELIIFFLKIYINSTFLEGSIELLKTNSKGIKINLDNVMKNINWKNNLVYKDDFGEISYVCGRNK